MHLYKHGLVYATGTCICCIYPNIREEEREFSLLAIYSVLLFRVNIFYENKCQCLYSVKQPRDFLSS